MMVRWMKEDGKVLVICPQLYTRMLACSLRAFPSPIEPQLSIISQNPSEIFSHRGGGLRAEERHHRFITTLDQASRGF